ncbi:MAG: hypothetical protein JO239_10345 [Paraburkholderia sp.]|nr:hypothetical protein [Paraburkholderia sp.]
MPLIRFERAAFGLPFLLRRESIAMGAKPIACRVALAKIESVRIEQSLIGRILDGSLIVGGGGNWRLFKSG